jgi:hypothetical protein
MRVSYRPLLVCDHVIAPLVLFSIRSRELPEERPAQTQWLKEECGQGRHNVWRSGWSTSENNSPGEERNFAQVLMHRY